MGGTPSISTAEFTSLQQQVVQLNNKVSDYNILKQKLQDTAESITSKLTDADFIKIAQRIPINDLSTEILNQPNTLGEALANIIVSDKGGNVVSNITSGLEKNEKFATTVSDVLTSDTYQYKELIKGPRGEAGGLDSSIAAIKSKLYDKKYTMWCADGDLCNTPPGVPGVQIGEWRIEQRPDGNLSFKVGQGIDRNDKLQQSYIEMSRDGNVFVSRDGGRGWVADQLKNNNELVSSISKFTDKDFKNGTLKSEFLHSRGQMGPYHIRFFDKGDQCLNSDLNLENCDRNNNKHKWWYSSVGGLLYNQGNDKCLDTFGDNWQMNGCNSHQNQQFWKQGHTLRSGWGSCLDTGNNNHRANCDSNEKNQKHRFEYIG